MDALPTISYVFAFQVFWFQWWAKLFQCIIYIFGYKAPKWTVMGGGGGSKGKGSFSNSQNSS